MTRDQIVAHLCASGLMPCWRHDDTAGIIDASLALAEVGFSTVELTVVMPKALRLIEEASARLPASVVVGAGTVLDAETARLAILAGARYVVSPILVPEIIEMCHRYNAVAIPGCATPTEIQRAHTLGADLIKIFPAGSGPLQHIMLAEMRSVFPGLRTVVTGGAITLADAGGFMSAGADSMVVGMPVMAAEAYARRDFAAMRRVAERLVASVAEARRPAAREAFVRRWLERYADLDGAADAGPARGAGAPGEARRTAAAR
jgi:2-dehydro-3-deoxyphosphogluconate aldolase/(4S)-4-hydroxy-2-oxoglutarate aldolase